MASRAAAGTGAGYTNSGYLGVVGSGGAVFTAQADTSAISASDKGVRHGLFGVLDIFRVHARQSFNEPTGNISLDDDLAVCGHVADDTRHTIQPSNLLAIELLAAVKRDRDTSGVERQSRRDHLEQLGDTGSERRGNERHRRIGFPQPTTLFRRDR